ncbi:hypothetical protein [Caulobacter sp. DWP3-1-3b2]|uniref:hypothetical protein n=1 Tax=Caulobacter sp. DWP3-1-3b2 TaxID=2804643 RepID=UPI003CF19804
MDLDAEQSAVFLRVEAPDHDHSLTIVIPAGPTNTGFMFPVTVPAGNGGELVVSVSNAGGPERQFLQRWRLDGAAGSEALPAREAAGVIDEANADTAAVFAQIAAQQATARHKPDCFACRTY